MQINLITLMDVEVFAKLSYTVQAELRRRKLPK